MAWPDDKPISEAELKKNRRTAVMLGISASIAMIAMVYAFVQKGMADEQAAMINTITAQLHHCAEEAELNKRIATHEMKRADSLVTVMAKKK